MPDAHAADLFREHAIAGCREPQPGGLLVEFATGAKDRRRTEGSDLRHRAIKASLLALLPLALAFPGVAAAKLKTFGSLGSAASVAETHGTDTAFWDSAAPGASAAIPLKGQVRVVKIRGCAEQGLGGQTPLTQFHVQILAPKGGGVTVSTTSYPLNLPVCSAGGSPTRVNVWRPKFLCISAGDYVDFNDEGGFAPPGFPGGVPYEVFAPESGVTTQFFNGGDETNNGDSFSGSPLNGIALLMQVVVGTGKNVGPACIQNR